MHVFYHPDQKRHVPRTYLSRGQMRAPQEVPERTEHLLEGLDKLGCSVSQPNNHGMAPISAVHDLGYLRFLESAHRRWKDIPDDWGDEVMSNVFVRSPNPMKGILAEAARYQADGSCPIGPHTWEAAYWSAQSALSGVDSILAGDSRAYALCRPPGHHARRDAAGGFCYLNNAAIAAEALRQKFSRVAILDTDMHHGQGIQEIFYERDDVLYVSVHGDPTNFYPVVAGYEEERGAGRGEGYNINLPMPHGSDESVFFKRVEEAMAALKVFAPEVLILPLGFDIYREDPQAKVSVTTDGLQRLGARFAEAGVPTLVVQEGGYFLDALAQNVGAFFKGLNG